jgi:hypothetical protein
MRSQGGFEALVVTSSLIFILTAVLAYSYFVGSQLSVLQDEADFFEDCSKLQSRLISSTLSDREIVTFFLYNLTIDGDTMTAYPLDPKINYLCPILVPVNGTITIPNRWYYPVNATKFVSEGGLVNITWGWYT